MISTKRMLFFFRNLLSKGVLHDVNSEHHGERPLTSTQTVLTNRGESTPHGTDESQLCRTPCPFQVRDAAASHARYRSQHCGWIPACCHAGRGRGFGCGWDFFCGGRHRTSGPQVQSSSRFSQVCDKGVSPADRMSLHFVWIRVMIMIVGILQNYLKNIFLPCLEHMFNLKSL